MKMSICVPIHYPIHVSFCVRFMFSFVRLSHDLCVHTPHSLEGSDSSQKWLILVQTKDMVFVWFTVPMTSATQP